MSKRGDTISMDKSQKSINSITWNKSGYIRPETGVCASVLVGKIWIIMEDGKYSFYAESVEFWNSCDIIYYSTPFLAFAFCISICGAVACQCNYP